MMYPITATKTFSQWELENPEFYNERLEDGDIDTATIKAISDWYGIRIVCDDNNFTRFYGRQLDLLLPRYNKLVRLENTEFDAMVNAYRERQIIDKGSELEAVEGEATETSTNNTTDSRSSTRTPNLTTTNSETRHDDIYTETYDHLTGNDRTTGTSDTAGVAKQAPQSISYPQTAVGAVPNLDWQYPSSQQQSKGNTASSGTNESEDQKTIDTDNDIRKSGSAVRTGTETIAESGGIEKRGSKSNETEKSRELTSTNTKQEIWTGRDMLTPQDALKKAMAYVRTSSAFEWLKENLDVCFLSVYDI